MDQLFRRALAAAFAVVAIAGLSAPAQANFRLTLSEGGVSTVTTTVTESGGVGVYTASYGDFTVNIDILTSNSPGDAGSGFLRTQLTLERFPGSAGNGNLTVGVTELTPYTLPGTPGSKVTLTSLENVGAPAATTTTFSSTASSTTVTNPTITGNGVDSKSTTFTRGFSYTLSNQFVIHNVPYYQVVNESGTSTVTSLVPEPATLASAIAGLPLLGLGCWLRRRKAQA